jgi:chitinase
MVPQAQINHPGDMEMRPAGVPIPFVGVGTDPQDGTLSGASLVWTSDLSGQFGTGQMFDAPLTVGTHIITLTVTDSDSNTGTDSITLYIQ